jgi:hypothetical protein
MEVLKKVGWLLEKEGSPVPMRVTMHVALIDV